MTSASLLRVLTGERWRAVSRSCSRRPRQLKRQPRSPNRKATTLIPRRRLHSKLLFSRVQYAKPRCLTPRLTSNILRISIQRMTYHQN
ncbi:hypothetical protein FOCC_FOCC002020 [Frankliniella occidentalis]|nr:hypothetical protein FOCC_FOCC002020 [Frankliniella occidentalis]